MSSIKLPESLATMSSDKSNETVENVRVKIDLDDNDTAKVLLEGNKLEVSERQRQSTGQGESPGSRNAESEKIKSDESDDQHCNANTVRKSSNRVRSNDKSKDKYCNDQIVTHNKVQASTSKDSFELQKKDCKSNEKAGRKVVIPARASGKSNNEANSNHGRERGSKNAKYDRDRDRARERRVHHSHSSSRPSRSRKPSYRHRGGSRVIFITTPLTCCCCCSQRKKRYR